MPYFFLIRYKIPVAGEKLTGNHCCKARAQAQAQAQAQAYPTPDPQDLPTQTRLFSAVTDPNAYVHTGAVNVNLSSVLPVFRTPKPAGSFRDEITVEIVSMDGRDL